MNKGDELLDKTSLYNLGKDLRHEPIVLYVM